MDPDPHLPDAATQPTDTLTVVGTAPALGIGEAPRSTRFLQLARSPGLDAWLTVVERGDTVPLAGSAQDR